MRRYSDVLLPFSRQHFASRTVSCRIRCVREQPAWMMPVEGGDSMYENTRAADAADNLKHNMLCKSNLDLCNVRCRAVVRNHASGRKICVAGFSTRDNNWTVPCGPWKVKDLQQLVVYNVNDDDILIDKDSPMQITAVLWFECRSDVALTADHQGLAAPDTYSLSNLVRDGELKVFSAPWGQAIPRPIVRMPFEEKQLMNLDAIRTPRTPSSSSGRS